MDRTAVYETEVHGIKAEMVIDYDMDGCNILVKVDGKKLTESSLTPVEMEALRRFFTE
jgi:hypothetical protein